MATQTAGRGLSTDDLTRIRDTLAAGRKPKVQFTEAAGQIAGQVGQVVRLTDPAASDEWVVVRFGRDELPFAPTDLAVPSRAAPVKVPSRRPSADPLPSPREEIQVPRSPSPAAASPANRAANGSPGAAPKASPAAAAKPGATAAAKAPAPAPAAEGRVEGKAEGNADAKAERKASAPRKAARPKAPPSLTVTLTYAEGEWLVGATQGSRALAKPYVIKPAEALKMISMLDVSGVREAVEDIVSAARAEAEREAERLRAELAEVESRLAELRDAG